MENIMLPEMIQEPDVKPLTAPQKRFIDAHKMYVKAGITRETYVKVAAIQLELAEKNDECLVCADLLVNNTDIIVSFPCLNHMIHRDCLKSWMESPYY